jgi:galactokinase
VSRLERVVAFAPGRVNLIGEHTDYNEGLCLPFAIDHGVTVTAVLGERGEIEASTDRGDSGVEEDRFAVAEPGPASGWRAFVHGIVAELGAEGYELPGTRLSITSDLQSGSGLSSSAALEVAVALAMLALAGVSDPDRLRLAEICSRVEHAWLGADTGLLDQLSTLFGQAGAALQIDCRTNDVEPVPLQLDGWALATLDSGAQRDLAQSGYNQRREECRRAAELLGVPSLRTASLDAIERLPAPLGRRARHVITENDRVRAAVEALRAGDLHALGELLNTSHASLRDDFGVSVPEVEATVAGALAAGARGARIMGGGFGGAVLALFPPGMALPDGANEVSPGAGASCRGNDGSG